MWSCLNGYFWLLANRFQIVQQSQFNLHFCELLHLTIQNEVELLLLKFFLNFKGQIFNVFSISCDNFAIIYGLAIVNIREDRLGIFYGNQNLSELSVLTFLAGVSSFLFKILCYFLHLTLRLWIDLHIAANADQVGVNFYFI